MRIIKRSHQHIKPETINEYLDGRIQGSALARVDQQLAACHLCREEMESLRSTVTMLRELPQEAPRRSFVMTAPPPMPARAPSSAFQLGNLLRVPQWAYAGAASVAVIVLVVLISADATGLLSPDGASQFQGQATAITQEIESRAAETGPLTSTTGIENQELGRAALSPSSEAGDGDIQAAAPVAPPAPPEDSTPQAAPAPVPMAAEAAPEQSLAAVPAQESPVQEFGEEATTDKASAPVALAAEASPEQTAPAAPAKEPSPEETVEALGPRGAPGAVSGDAPAERQTPMSAPPEVEKVPTATVSTGVSQPQSEGTAMVWRVLEGVAALFGLIFLVALGFKRRLSDKSGLG